MNPFDETTKQTQLKGRDIVVIGLQPWYYEIGSNCKNMALQFARENRVLYVNMPVNRKTYFSKNKTAGVQSHCDRIKTRKDTLEKIDRNLWQYYPTSIVESINWLPSTSAFKYINRINNKRFAADIKTAISELGFTNVILFNDNDSFNGYELKELLQPDLYIYYSRDFLQGYPYFRKHTTVIEPELISKADLVVANSVYLSDYCEKYNSRSFYIGQGCNIELFNSSTEHAVPPEVISLKRPVIGYVGAIISERLDINIIRKIATSHPEWNVVLVGPEDETFANSELHQMSNIHFVGRRPMESLPAYVASFDVCINPQLNNLITVGNYPLKIDEYLAMGKPVVATRTRTMSMFEDHTYLADSVDEYPALIEKALRENIAERQEARIAFARSHTWENTMAELYRLIKKYSPLEQNIARRTVEAV
jgi:teichuronic acid biosynthesis glycosyltransferase TuaH